jgi:hypothetical protein
MFRKLVSRNSDLAKLVDRGYAVAFASNCLVVRDVPYIGGSGDLRWGTLVAKLVFVDQEQVTQDDHQVYFAGGHPYQLDGTPVANLGGGASTIQLAGGCTDVVVERSFSNKPKAAGRYADFYEKIDTYVGLISAPAIERFGVSPFTFRASEDEEQQQGPFKFRDTLTSRAQIGDLAGLFDNDVVAVIGLGGTGAYLLDGLVKTPVAEVRGFDGDEYHVHNTFRSPGRVDEAELGRSKADVYRERYDNYRHRLRIEARYVDETSADAFKGVTFAFVCVDKGSARGAIFELLISLGIPFIDVGMGLNRKHGPLNGQLRVTHYSVEDGARMRDRGFAELADTPGDFYRANIQIGELNAMNACLALIRFKQIRGFYQEERPIDHLLFGVGDLELVGDGQFDEV